MKRGYWSPENGKRIHYVKAGDGKQVLLLLHGIANSMEQWVEEIKNWSRDFTVYAFSFPGCGFSDSLNQHKMSLDFIPLFIEKFVEAFEIKNPVIVGGSFGGLAAIEYTRHFQNKVKKLVLVSSAGLGKEINQMARIASIPIVGEILYYLRRDKDAPHNIGITLRFMRTGVNIFGQKKRIYRLEHLKNINVPVLIVHGSNDEIFPVQHSIRAAEILPDSKLHIFEKADHWPPETHREEFCDLVREFVRD
ncbi:MAG: alpha/beta hydrolase [Candidatus Spechtbacterales bacterium]